MKIVDVNVLVYAADESAKHHEASKNWIERALSGSDRVLFPWITLIGFARIITHTGIMANPRSADEAIDQIEEILSAPGAVVATPGREHPALMREMLAATGTGGNLVNDAHLAALARQYRATVVSFDNDFTRFPGIRWEKPNV